MSPPLAPSRAPGASPTLSPRKGTAESLALRGRPPVPPKSLQPFQSAPTGPGWAAPLTPPPMASLSQWNPVFLSCSCLALRGAAPWVPQPRAHACLTHHTVTIYLGSGSRAGLGTPTAL